MIVPTLHFPGNCIDVIRLYEDAFTVTGKEISFFSDAPDDSGMKIHEEMRNKIMHARITICGSEFNCSDAQHEIIAGNMHLYNVFLESEDDLRRAFNTLKAEGKVVVDLGPQFFSPLYASVRDTFGVQWQLILLKSES